MSSRPPGLQRPVRAPTHLWVVGLLLVLWNCWGLFGAVAAQRGLFPMPDEAVSYFEQQPAWFMLLADLSPLAGVAGSIALLMQSRWASLLFAAQLAIVVLANLYEVVIGTSLLLRGGPVVGSTIFLAVVLAAQVLYARYLLKRDVLY